MRIRWIFLALLMAFGASAGVARYVQGQDAQAARSVPITPSSVGVRVLFGHADTQPTAWDGSLSVSGGSLLRLEGWRFRQQDEIVGGSSWRASTRRQQPGAGARRAGRMPPMTPNGVVAILSAGPETEVRVTTPRGEFRFKPLELGLGQSTRFLNGEASAERVPPSFQLTGAETEDDFPAAAVDREGTLWVAYVAYRYGQGERTHLRPFQQEPASFDFLRTTGNGDQVRLARFTPGATGSAWSEVAALTEPGGDVHRPTLAAAGDGSVWVVWAQNTRGNWDLYGRRFRGSSMGRTMRITTDAGPDLHPVLAADPAGGLWLAWQGFRGENGDIFLTSLPRGGERWSAPARVSTSPRNDWDPQVACSPDGAVHVAWDTYDAGNYDVMLRRMAGGRLAEPVAVAATSRFEARPTLACDARNRVWVAWEEAPEGWGKDFGYGIEPEGVPLYRGHTVGVRCFVDGRPQSTAGDLFAAFPQGLRQQHSFPRLAAGRDGRIFLTFRHPRPELRGGAGTVWLSYVTSYQGGSWSIPTLIPDSDGLLDNRPALAAGGATGPLYMVYASDGRNRAFGRPTRHELFVSPVAWSGAPAEAPALVAAEAPAAARAAAEVASERADVARIRGFRTRVGGKELQLMRGEFHRHTEISGDGGGDGPLIDMFRYALDAAQMDWIGNGDHDNGGGREYTWWLTQKLTDAFHLQSRFVPMFTYERSVRYPDGHRNVMFARRGIRTLPRLAGDQQNGVARGDTPMLYKYLRAFDGICAVHTSATDMGTDWRDNDPKVEPFVEIYQGDRQNYEYQGAPRSGKEGESPGGFQPAGFVWNALAKGYRLGFQSSSDHISTHISYAIVYAERPTREAILAGFKKRHCYGATDNIVLEVRSGENMMGDEFETRQPPRLQVRATGTRPVARVVIVKDNKVVYTATPGSREVNFTWVDNKPQPGVSYYYVRLEQEDGELAWASPMWIRYLLDG